MEGYSNLGFEESFLLFRRWHISIIVSKPKSRVKYEYDDKEISIKMVFHS